MPDKITATFRHTRNGISHTLINLPVSTDCGEFKTAVTIGILVQPDSPVSLACCDGFDSIVVEYDC